MAITDERVVFAFFEKLLANAERIKNIIKNLHICLNTDLSLDRKIFNRGLFYRLYACYSFREN